jgi:hypothetical protein
MPPSLAWGVCCLRSYRRKTDSCGALRAISFDCSCGRKPDMVIYDTAMSRVLGFNGDSNSATAIQAADGKVAGTIDLGGGPEFAVADGSGYVYDNLEEQSMLLKINARPLKSKPCPTPPCAFAFEHEVPVVGH